MDLPTFFPCDFNRRLAGLSHNVFRKRFRVVFQDYGRSGHVDVKQDDSNSSQTLVYTAQRQHNKVPDRSVLCARIPTIPLSQIPAKVHCPLRDDVIRDLPYLPAKVKKFSRSLEQVSSSTKRGARSNRLFQIVKKTLDKISDNDMISEDQLETMEGSLMSSVSNMLHLYTDLSQQPSLRAHNSDYSGGLVSCVQNTDGVSVRHFLFHAQGQDLDRLALTIASPSDSHLVESCVAAERKGKRMFQVDAAAVRENVFVATRQEDSCSVFSIPKADCVDVHLRFEGNESDEYPVTGGTAGVCSRPCYGNTLSESNKLKFTYLGRCSFSAEDKMPTSVCVSPYLPGEGVFCGESGMVKLWSARQGVVRTVEKPPRFECCDSWCCAYYAGHPRQLVLADRTAVQMVDQRDGFRSSVDLLGLPSPLVHNRECIMAVCRHGNGCPLHVVATSQCVFVVDQRFGGSPVMQWYPDLKGPVQYLTSMDYHTEGGERRGVVLAGSQHPAEVMCYPFNHGNGLSVTTSLSPWRLSKMSDISDNQHYACFHRAVDPLLLEERLKMSLAGLAVAKGSLPSSFLTYQADCYGELYFQQYGTPDSARTAIKTGVPPPGKRDHQVPLDVQDHVNSWLEHLQKQVSSLKRALRTKKLRGQRLRAFRQQLFNSEEDEQTTERCSLCGDDTDACIKAGIEKDDLLCGSCQAFHLHSSAERTQSQNTSRCPSDRDSGNTISLVSEGLSLLDGVVPSIDSYEASAFTSVHLECMKPQPQMSELIVKREEKYAQLLENLKSKIRRVQERKGQKRKAEEGSGDDDNDDDDVDNTALHGVFNTAEHQQQNSRINDVLSKMVKPQKPETISADVAFSAMQGDSDSENTPPGVVEGEMSYDLFQESEEETMLPPQNLSQDDDDDFFGSQDLFAPIPPASPHLIPSQNSTLASPALTPSQGQRRSESNRNTPDSDHSFITSSQKEPHHRPSSSKRLNFFSPQFSRGPVSERVTHTESVSSQPQPRPPVANLSQRQSVSRNSSVLSLQDMPPHGSPTVRRKKFLIPAVGPGQSSDVTQMTDIVPDSQPTFVSPCPSPSQVPQSPRFRTPERNVSLTSLTNYSSLSEKRKLKSAKKHRLSLGGFC